MSSLTSSAFATPVQAELFEAPRACPDGLLYQPDLIDAGEEAALADELSGLTFEPFDFHGYLANRQVAGFGLRYDYGRRSVVEAPPMPAWLLALRDRVGLFAGRPADDFAQVLINEYRPGAGIGWHKDKPHFGEIVGVSLLSPCRLRFRCKSGETWDRLSMQVEPRSAYLLSGPARSVWEHSIPPLDKHRYSITFRTLADRR
jgi:alkylated DNA repair dioxygenase AlkB